MKKNQLNLKKKEKFEFELKKIIELELNQNLKELIEFKDKISDDLILNISEKKLFDKIYGFGSNGCGQLGIEKGDKIKTPTIMSFFKDKKIRTLSSGWNNTIVLTGNQSIFLLIFDLRKKIMSFILLDIIPKVNQELEIIQNNEHLKKLNFLKI